MTRSARQPPCGASCRCGPYASMIWSRCSTLLIRIRSISRPLKDGFGCSWQTRVCEPSYNSFTARAIVLQRFTVAHRIVKPELVNNGLQIVKPELCDEFRVASRAFSLRHLTSAFLI